MATIDVLGANGEVHSVPLGSKITLHKHDRLVDHTICDKIIKLKYSEIKIIMLMLRDCDMNNFISKKKMHEWDESEGVLSRALRTLKINDWIKDAAKKSGLKIIKKGYMINPKMIRKSRVITEYFVMIHAYNNTDRIIIAKPFRQIVKEANGE